MTATFHQVVQRLAPVGGPLVGRGEEMETVREAWTRAAAGAGGMVLLAGDPGAGKTRLAAELAGEVEATGACVLVGSCPAAGAEPYHPLIEALGPLPAGERDRSAMHATLASGVVARARRTPMLLVLDDLHRADRSTLHALRTLVEAVTEAPVLVLGTFRDTALDRSHPLSEFLADEQGRPGVERLRLSGLTEDAVAQMVGDADLGRRMWRQSAGNPVWVAELLRMKSLPAAAEGPISFDDLVARRMGQLTPVARSFLQAAAVSGSAFRISVAAAAADGPVGRVNTALKQVVAAGFVVEEAAGPGDTRRFVHDMVREAVERATPAATRVHIHLRIARALDGHGAPGTRDSMPVALLAWHFRAAAPVGGSSRALRYSARAGELAMEMLAWDEAAEHYGHALAAATGVAPAVRADLLLSLGEAQHLAGESNRARQAFLEAAALARSGADGARMARVALALGQLDKVWGADPDLEAVAGEARALLGQAGVPELPPSPVLAPSTDFASEWLYDVLDGVPTAPPPPPALAPAPGPVGAARPARSAAEGAALLRARHVALAGPEYAVDRLEAAEETVGLAQVTGDPELAVTGHGWRVADTLELGRMQDVVAAQAAHAEAARNLGRSGPLALAATYTAMRALLEGRAGDARSAMTHAFDLAVEAGEGDAGDTLLLQRWGLALEWGTADELAEVVEEYRTRASQSADSRMWRPGLALARARSGQLDLAAEELRRVTDHGFGELARDPGRLVPLCCLGEVAWVLGDARRAAMVGALLEPFADHVAVAGRAVLCHGSVARACGLAAAAAHRWDDAERHFRTALAVHRTLGAQPLLARTRYDRATVLLARGRHADRRRAADARRKAADLATRLGMTWLSEEMARPT